VDVLYLLVSGAPVYLVYLLVGVCSALVVLLVTQRILISLSLSNPHRHQPGHTQNFHTQRPMKMNEEARNKPALMRTVHTGFPTTGPPSSSCLLCFFFFSSGSLTFLGFLILYD